MNDSTVVIAILVALLVGAMAWGAMAFSGWRIIEDFLAKYQKQTRDRTFKGASREPSDRRDKPQDGPS